MNKEPLVLLAAAVLCGALGGGCGAEQGDEATVSYASSGCKSKPAGQALVTAAGPASVAAYDGLKCVAWQATDDVATFRIYNMEGGCSARYLGQAYLSDGGRSVTLSLTNPSGAIAGCGWCLYDYTFEVQGIAARADLSVTIQRSNTAERGKEGSDEFVLPARLKESGVVCRYAHQYALQWHAMTLGSAGTRHMPCADAIAAPVAVASAPCQAGLTCVAVTPASGHRVCLASCAGDDDCGGDLYRCQSGSCWLR